MGVAAAERAGDECATYHTAIPVITDSPTAAAHGNKRVTVDGLAASWRPPSYAISDGGHKLIMHAAEGGAASFEAYDVIADPEEANDLLADGQRPGWIGKLEDVLRGYATACKQVARPTTEAAGLPVAVRVRLKSFGYLD